MALSLVAEFRQARFSVLTRQASRWPPGCRHSASELRDDSRKESLRNGSKNLKDSERSN
jgi:hypothetical protein